MMVAATAFVMLLMMVAATALVVMLFVMVAATAFVMLLMMVAATAFVMLLMMVAATTLVVVLMAMLVLLSSTDHSATLHSPGNLRQLLNERIGVLRRNAQLLGSKG